MSRAMSRRLDNLSAPVTAWLIENGYVIDIGGMLGLHFSRHSIVEAILVAARATQGHAAVPVPDIRSAADRHNTPYPRERL